MTKQDLLNELSQNTFVMLKPSAVEGIGVFAVQDIPIGCRQMFAKENKEIVEWISLSKHEVNNKGATADTDGKAKTISLGAIMFF